MKPIVLFSFLFAFRWDASFCNFLLCSLFRFTRTVQDLADHSGEPAAASPPLQLVLYMNIAEAVVEAVCPNLNWGWCSNLKCLPYSFQPWGTTRVTCSEVSLGLTGFSGTLHIIFFMSWIQDLRQAASPTSPAGTIFDGNASDGDASQLPVWKYTTTIFQQLFVTFLIQDQQ